MTSGLTPASFEDDGFAELSDVAWNSLDQLSRALRLQDSDLDGTLAAILVSATELVEPAKSAGINLYVKRKFVPQVVLGDEPPLLDQLQQQTGDGPCIEASREQATVDVPDLTDDDRWPRFAPAAVELGVLSMLCVPLWVDERKLGSLSLYARQTHAFDDHAAKVATLFATHAALALADAQRTDQLSRMVASRDVIGQAKGVLMERHRVTADQAFEMLTRVSQNSNRKLSEVAETLATTGQLPPGVG